MPSTYSTSLRLELMADGEKSGTWGTITNTNLGTLIEQGVAGVASVAHDDSASYTLTTNNGSSDEARNAVVLMTGALTADREVIVPDVDKVYIFKNGTSGGFALTFKTSGGSGVTIPNGRAAICYVDSGTGTVNAIDDGYFTDSIYIEGSSAGDFITAESTNAGSGSGPDIKLYRNSASPADSDVLSKITFTANTDDGAGGVSVSDVEYASINVSAPETNETSGEAGKMVIALKRGGTTQNYIEIQGGTSADTDNDSIVFKTGGTAAITIDNSQDVTFSGAISGTTATFTTSDNNPQLIIKSTDADANDGPVFDLVRDSASPADNDFIGSIRFRADDSAGNETQYADIRVITNDVTDGTEDGQFNLRTMLGGTLRLRLKADPTETVFNEESQDLDFRVESDSSTHALFVDAGKDVVTIGNSAPETWYGGYDVLQIGLVGSIASNETSADTDVLQIMSNQYLDASATWRFMEGSTGATKLTMQGQDIQFYMSDSAGAADAGITYESRMRMDSSSTTFNEGGNDLDFRVESDGATHALFVNAGSNRIIFGGTDTVNGADVEFLLGSGVSETPYVSIRNNATGTLTTDASARLDIGTWTNNGAYPNASNSYTGKLLFLAQATDNAYAAGGIESYLKTAGSRTRANTDSQLRFSVKDQTSTSAVEYFRLSGDEKSVVFNQLSADQDFRVESDTNAYAFFVDGGSNVIGSGTSTPATYVGTGGFALKGATVSDLALVSTSVASGSNSHQIKYYNEAGASYEIARTRVNVGAGQVNRGEYQFAVNNGAGLRRWLDVNYGGNVVFNDDGHDSDFRIEGSGDANLIFADASQDRVYVGVAANIENAKLGIAGAKTLSAGIPQGGLGVTDTTAMAQSVGGGITLNGKYKTDGTYTSFAGIEAEKENGTDNHYGGKLILKARKNGSTNVPRLELGQSEAVFNQDSEDTDFRIESDSEANMFVVDAGNNKITIANTYLNGPLNVFNRGGTFESNGWGDTAITTYGSFGGGIALVDSQNMASTAKAYIIYTADSGNDFYIQNAPSRTSTTGGVYLNNAATSWSSASDERDKENLVNITGAVDNIKTLRAVKGNYIDQPDVDKAFLIAQDVNAFLPEAVSVRNKDAEAADQRYGLDYQQLIPVLVAAIKEQQTTIEDLETRLAALENA